jgi:hypothetical protein
MQRLCFTGLPIFAGIAMVSLLGQSSDGTESPEALVKQVFAALERKDSTALQQLAISQADFEKFVWPNITARPEGTNADKFYKMYSTSSRIGMEDYLKQYGARKVEVLRVTLNPPSKQTKSYRLLPGAQISLRDDTGQEKTITMLGSVLERDGRYKVATYYVRPLQ